jgi:hypothetical protein
MRKRLVMVAGPVLLVFGAIYLWGSRPPAPPSASIYVIGYESRQDSVVATIVLTNTGMSALNYDDSSGGVYYKVVARVQGRETNLSSGGGPSSIAGPVVVWPSRSKRIHVPLPVGTETWRCTIPVQRTGPRDRVFMRLGESGIWNKTFPVSQWFIRLFPLGDSAQTEIQSDTFNVSTNAVL